MNAILFVGLQASGKSSFYRSRFSDTHVRVNLDMLKTRHRESRLIDTCIEIEQPFVVDNTNISRSHRERYLPRLCEAGVPVTGYYFQSGIEQCKTRNEARSDSARVPLKGLLGTHARLEVPHMDEGFAALFYVRISESREFVVEEWQA